MIELSKVIGAVFTIYGIIMLWMGYTASRSTHSPNDFFLANRSLKAWVTAISSTASSESAWAVMGTVGLAYKDGLSALWFFPGCLLGYALNWFFIAERLREHSHQKGSLTIPDYLETHFNDHTHLLRITSVIIIFACMMAYIAAQFLAIGKTFDAIFDISHLVSIPIGGAIVIFYTMMGGFRAVAWTDFIQGLLMVIGLVVLSLTAAIEVGGFAAIPQKVNSLAPTALTWMGGKTTTVFLGSMIGLLGIGLGYPGQPHVITRYMAAKDTNAIKQGTWIAFGWGTLMYSSAILLGICGKVLFPGLSDPEHLYPTAAEHLLPIFLTAFVMTSLLAAIMSTISSQLIVAASAMAHDIYSKIITNALNTSQVLTISRLTIFFIGLGAMLIALNDIDMIFWFVLFAWSGLGASFGPVILFTLYYKKTSREGAIGGILTGFLTTIIWKVTGLSESIIYELVPAFFLSSIIIWQISRRQAGNN
jgi:sodium/proline symporter